VNSLTAILHTHPGPEDSKARPTGSMLNSAGLSCATITDRRDAPLKLCSEGVGEQDLLRRDGNLSGRHSKPRGV
jgi:hypothetical protein